MGRVGRGGKLLLFWPAAGLVGEDWWGERGRAERNGLVVSDAAFGEVGDEDEAVGYREGDGDAISELPEDVAGDGAMGDGADWFRICKRAGY